MRIAAFILLLCVVATVQAGSTGEHWAFRKISRPALPSGGSAAETRTPIDAFLLASTAGGHLQPEADRRTLIRRLSFDLRGLPPSPAEVEAFVKDSSAKAWDQLVERFLGSPQYGERWGRHWLDATAYADSNGYFSADSDRPLAWKYRDYVVNSINNDKPFDRFIMEQIAGDELAGVTRDSDFPPAISELLTATHFWRNVPDGTGESDGNPLEVKVDRYSVLEGNVQLIGSAFLGLTVQCARCHDHKFEPITQEDYYGLQAILRPAFDPDHWLKPNERAISLGTRIERDQNSRELREQAENLKTLKESLEGLTAPFRARLVEEKLSKLEEAERKKVRQALDTKEKQRTEEMKTLLKKHQTAVNETELVGRFPEYPALAQPLNDAIAKIEKHGIKPLPQIAGVVDPALPPPVHHLLVRGNHAREGKEIPPAVPAAFRKRDCSFQAGGQRRATLGRWLISPENPLVARVLVNRIWRNHFGTGLAATADNLGKSGAAPEFPKLIDWLAADFMENGWSLKHLHRQIVNSAAYRQASAQKSGSLLDGFPLRRLDAESIRDAMLAVSGELNLSIGGPYAATKTDSEGQVIIPEESPGKARRSLYLQQRRTQPVQTLAVFDGPAHNPVCIQRVQSTVALQSLELLNSGFIRARAKAFAHRLLIGKGTSESDEGRIATAFQLAASRPPTSEEASVAKDFVNKQSTLYTGKDDALVRAWTDFCQMLLASNQFLYVE